MVNIDKANAMLAETWGLFHGLKVARVGFSESARGIRVKYAGFLGSRIAQY